jgi:hypothetical protein
MRSDIQRRSTPWTKGVLSRLTAFRRMFDIHRALARGDPKIFGSNRDIHPKRGSRYVLAVRAMTYRDLLRVDLLPRRSHSCSGISVHVHTRLLLGPAWCMATWVDRRNLGRRRAERQFESFVPEISLPINLGFGWMKALETIHQSFKSSMISTNRKTRARRTHHQLKPVVGRFESD